MASALEKWIEQQTITRGKPPTRKNLTEQLYFGGKTKSNTAIQTLAILKSMYPETSMPDLAAEIEQADISKGIRKQKAKIALAGKKVPTPEQEPGLISRIFDVLSRPNYASAEAVQTMAEGGGLGDIVKNVGRGLAGKEKTTFSDVAETAGITNPIAKNVLGFAGDVLLDPTTYIGVGVARKFTQEAMEAAGTKAWNKAAKTAKEQADEIVKTEQLSRGARQEPLLSKQKAEARAKDIEAQIKYDAHAAGKSEFMGKNANKVSLNIMGKPIVSSEAAYSGAAWLGKRLGDELPFLKEANKLFRTRAKRSPELQSLVREKEAASLGQWAKEVEEPWENLRKQISDEGWTQIRRAREQGTPLDGVIDPKANRDLGPILRDFSDKMDEYYEEGIEMGIIRPGQRVENYVPHITKDRKLKTEAGQTIKVKPIGSQQPGFAGSRRYKEDIDSLEARGIEMVKHPVDLMLNRSAKQYQVRARFEFEKELVNTYGIQTARPQLNKKGELRAREDRRATSQALKMGYEKVRSPMLKNQTYYLPPPVAKVLKHTDEIFKHPEEMDKLLRTFDKVQSYIKFGLTVPNPAHHVTNASGDIFLNYLDGVVNPKRYWDSIRIATGKKDFKVKVGNKLWDASTIENMYLRFGLKSGFFQHEAGVTGFSQALKNNPLRKFSEGREDWTRMAHFIDSLKKEGADVRGVNDLNKAARKAADRVRKWSIDYGDLTDFEQKFMRRVIPFYTFMRKNIPLQLEAMAMRPGRVAVLPKAQRMVEQMAGFDREHQTPFEAIPQWMKEMSAIRVGQETFFTPRLPFFDIHQYDPTSEGGQGVVANILSQMTPFARIPIEFAQGKKLFSGAPISEGLPEYLASTLPMARTAIRQADEEVDPRLKKESMINYLTGAGYRQLTPQRKKGELRRREDVVSKVLKAINDEQRKKLKEEFGVGF